MVMERCWGDMRDMLAHKDVMRIVTEDHMRK